MTEAEELELARRDPTAFGDLLARHRDALFAFCYHLLGSFDDAEDAVQETLIRASEKFDDFVDKGSGSFRAWLVKIARNEVIDTIRKRRRNRQFPFDSEPEVIDSSPTPEEHAMRRSDRETFHALISKLQPDQRAVLEYRVADLSTAEIAELMGTSEANVRQIQKRAVHSARVWLPKEGRRRGW
jgi:RNA polymerase sigma-70 factor (ECF subfamily)